MYRTKHFRWKLMHVLVSLAHLTLVAAVAVSYIYDLGRTTRPKQWVHPAVAELNRCGLALSIASVSPFTFDSTSHILLKACFLVGLLGFTFNIALFASLLAVEPNRITLTEGEQHWRKQVVTFFSCLLNLFLAGGGVGLAITLSTKASDSRPLIAPLMCTYIQASMAFSTAVCDAVKNHREGQDLLD